MNNPQGGLKVIVAGSRSVTDFQVVLRAITDSGFRVSEVVSGTARGVDRLGEQWAKQNQIPVARFPADWDRYGKRAGYVRNEEMAVYADALVAVWDGTSKGTKHMIDLAKKHNKEVYVFIERTE